MDTSHPDAALLTRYRTELDALFGDRIERTVLFGSRARGDFHDESDYDVAVFLRDMGPWFEESKPVSRLEVEFFDQTGVWVQSVLLPAGSWDARTPLMHEIRHDGIDL